MEGVENMRARKYYHLEESVSNPGKYLIHLNFDEPTLPRMFTAGSYNVLMARLFNMSYADFLRFCRDRYGADIQGRKCMYPLPVFENNAKTMELVEELNIRMTIVVEERKKCI
jgi:hypothetical protein